MQRSAMGRTILKYINLSLVSFAYFYDQVDFDPRYDTTVDGRIIY